MIRVPSPTRPEPTRRTCTFLEGRGARISTTGRPPPTARAPAEAASAARVESGGTGSSGTNRRPSCRDNRHPQRDCRPYARPHSWHDDRVPGGQQDVLRGVLPVGDALVVEWDHGLVLSNDDDTFRLCELLEPPG